MKIDIVSIPVSDQTAAKEFYVKKLGFTVTRDNPMGPGQRWLQLAPPGGGPSVTLVTWFDNMPPGSQQGLVLDAEEVDAVHHLLRTRGVDVSPLQDAPWGRYATFRDPDGNGWVVQQAAAKA
jgi:catechol 2,3-dioxygenase-like lactoylglutathione lyase family enzyme